MGEIEKGRQGRPRFDRPGGHQLRHTEQLDARMFLIQGRVRHHAVGGAQIHADHVFRHEKTSQGFAGGAEQGDLAAMPHSPLIPGPRPFPGDASLQLHFRRSDHARRSLLPGPNRDFAPGGLPAVMRHTASKGRFADEVAGELPSTRIETRRDFDL